MKNLKDLGQNLGTLYYPKSAIVYYRTKGSNGCYIEHFDIAPDGRPVNAHPLTEHEAGRLAKALNTGKEKQEPFLKPVGVMASNILYINPAPNGKVVWFTPATTKGLFFSDNLQIPSGKAAVPPLLWAADRRNLSVYALISGRRPKESTPLYHAPFFNVDQNGGVCMGTVEVGIRKAASLEEFTRSWQDYFYNSYFSHLMQGHNPVKGNCVSLWQALRQKQMPFPKEVLIRANRTLKDILP